MTDILCTYEDGTTEMRGAHSPALPDYGSLDEDRWPKWGPADVVDIEVGRFEVEERKMTVVFREGLDLGIWLAARGEKKAGRRGTYVDELRKFQDAARKDGSRVTPLVWTAQWGWRPCKVETTDEQLARLTRERDEARRLCSLYAKRLTVDEYSELCSRVERATKEGWLL